jgi:transketolase
MRTAFIQELIVQARIHQEIFLVVGDLGYSVVEPFAREFPARYLNAGVAEQNMTGMAAGLASEGYHVFTYSIANFPTLRCLEQFRNDVCYHKHAVTAVAVGGGLAYGSLGYSHHALQDLAIMRTMPNMTILAPGDPGEAQQCLQWLVGHPGPSYLRLGKTGEKPLHSVKGIGEGPIKVRKGEEVCALISTGGILDLAIETAQELEKAGVRATVYSNPWLSPIGEGWFDQLKGYALLTTIEEHVYEGGLGVILGSSQAGRNKVLSFAVGQNMNGRVGSQVFLRQEAGLKADRIANLILDSLRLQGCI